MPVPSPAKPVDTTGQVIENRPVLPGGAILSLALEGPMPVPRAGQFVHLRLGPSPLLRRPFSVLGHGTASAGGARIELMYAVVGVGTSLLERLLPGARLGVLGPLGNGFEPGDAEELILVAGGRGAVPLYRLLESPEVGGRGVTFLFGARSAEFLWGLERLRQVEHRLATMDGTAGVQGTVIDLLSAALAERSRAAKVRILACGPEAMLRRVAETAASFAVESQVALESQMGCGIGICRGCVVPRRPGADSPWPRDGNARYATVCKEGPVFLGHEIDWEAMAESAATVAPGSGTL